MYLWFSDLSLVAGLNVSLYLAIIGGISAGQAAETEYS